VRKVPSPLNLPSGPGSVTYHYTVTNPGQITLNKVTLVDDKCTDVKLISGDSNNNSLLETSEAWRYSCVTTLLKTTVNFATARGEGNGMASVDTAIAQVFVGAPVVPPLIQIIKTPVPLALPFNGGSVTYTYKVSNPGTVALTNVTVTDNRCSNVTFTSGDGNSDTKLGTNEVWTYSCTTNILTTTVNTAVAKGRANGLTAIDTALATVTVEGAPIAPLIHVIKKADPIDLASVGGLVTYTYNVINPGTVSLDNVTLIDDKCTNVTFISGDNNGNSLLETNETWNYTCQQNVTETTLNTATATGHANGLTVSDQAFAEVVVSPDLAPSSNPIPTLPNTGSGSSNNPFNWIVLLSGMFVIGTILFALTHRNAYPSREK